MSVFYSLLERSVSQYLLAVACIFCNLVWYSGTVDLHSIQRYTRYTCILGQILTSKVGPRTDEFEIYIENVTFYFSSPKLQGH